MWGGRYPLIHYGVGWGGEVSMRTPFLEDKLVIYILLKKDPGEKRHMYKEIYCSSVRVNNWKQLKSQSIVDCLNKLWHNHKREPHVVIKKNEVGLCRMMWKVVPSTKPGTEDHARCDLPHACASTFYFTCFCDVCSFINMSDLPLNSRGTP